MSRWKLPWALAKGSGKEEPVKRKQILGQELEYLSGECEGFYRTSTDDIRFTRTGSLTLATSLDLLHNPLRAATRLAFD